MPRRKRVHHTRQEQRALAKSFFRRGYRNASEAGREGGVSERTMRSYFGRLRAGESLEERPRSGRPRVNTSTLRRRLAQIKRRFPREASAFYARQLERTSGHPISVSTVRRALHDLGYRYRKVDRKRLTKAHKAARVAFAQAHLEDDWTRTWSYDEAYFNLYRTDNRYWIKASTEEGHILW